MVKFTWKGEIGSVAGWATFFPGSASHLKVQMPSFAEANALQSAFEAEIKLAERRARSEIAAEITRKYGAV